MDIQNICIKEAFEVSAGWAFIEMAKHIPRKTYLSYLRRSVYGNLDLSEKGDDFWNFGPMKVTPQQQVVFLVKVYEHKTIFSRRNTDILKRVMIRWGVIRMVSGKRGSRLLRRY